MDTKQQFQKLQERLIELKLLPLSHYFELRDLMMLILVLNGNYIKIPIKLIKNVEGPSSTRQNEQSMIPKTKTKKAGENFWKRGSYLLNIILKLGKVNREQLRKKICHRIVLELLSQRLFGGQSVFLGDPLQLWKLQPVAESLLSRKSRVKIPVKFH